MITMANRDDAASIPGIGAPMRGTRHDGNSTSYPSAPTSHSGGPPAPESVVSSISTIVRVPVNESTTITRTTDPLNNTNWAVWKGCMRRTFTLCEVAGYVYGDIERPDPTLDPVGAENWDFNDAYAGILIYENISSSQKVYAGQDCSAHEMWNNLVAIHETVGPTTILMYVRALFECIAEKEDDILEHLDNLTDTWERVNTLSADDFKISDMFFKIIICSSLPPSWDNFTQAYIPEVRRHATRDPFENMSSREFISIIKGEAERRLKRKTESTNSAFNSKGRKGRKKPTSALKERSARAGANHAHRS